MTEEPFLPEHAVGIHLSLSAHENRPPTWEEQRDARYALCPADIFMVQVLPPEDDYRSLLGLNVFHWWQIDGAALELTKEWM